uniref:NADH dehydrogenase subunit 5 n=1 Tax=Paraschizogynium plumachela TaxID=3109024 RepID=UPI002E75EF6D|nr:NADH dehydrogenase subunit 5 [Paraschizogynium plumachela]WQM21757.1 NADH dehydrogenase subunit 5 [Paraschizogynium plumachela]
MYLMWGSLLLVFGLFNFSLGLYVMYKEIVYVIEVFLGKFMLMEYKIYLMLDYMSLSFCGVVMFISGMVILYSDEYMSGDKGKMKFCYMVLLFVLSMVLMVVGTNMVMILLGWDGLGLVSYVLVMYYQNVSSNNAAMITVLTNRIGDVGVILSIMMMVGFNMWDMLLVKLSGEWVNMLVIFILMGAMTKSAQMPFSAWLPAAMAAPTPVSSLVHSSTLVTAGVYLVIRFSYYFNGGMFSDVLLYISVMTMFMAGLGANYEMDLKKIIALSTLSQLGVMMMVLSLGMSNLAYFHLIMHAMFKAMLFLCAGIIIHSGGDIQDVRMMGMMSTMSPFVSGMIGVGSLSLGGFPFLSGFYSKDMILEYVYMYNVSMFMIIMIILGTMFTMLYSLRLMYYCVWMGIMKGSMVSYEEMGLMNVPVFIMGLLVVFMGSMIFWVMFFKPVFIFLSMKIKVMNLLLVVFSMWLSVLVYVSNFSLYTTNIWKYFFGGMWFLPMISSLITKNIYKNMLYYGKNIEQGWYEDFGSQGMFYMMKYEMKMNVEGGSMSVYLLLFVWLILFMLW